MNIFDHRFSAIESYIAALRSRYRQCVRRSLEKSHAAGLRYERLTDTAAILRLYGPALHRLYEAVALSSAHRLELLPLSFFHGLARRLPGRVGLTVVYHGDRVAAFNWNLLDGETYYFLFAGLDYELNPHVDLYFNLMYAEMDHAFRAGAETLVFGQTADDFKTRLGCHQERRFFYVAPSGPRRGPDPSSRGRVPAARAAAMGDPSRVPRPRSRAPLPMIAPPPAAMGGLKSRARSSTLLVVRAQLAISGLIPCSGSYRVS